MTLTFNAVIPFLQKTLWLVVINIKPNLVAKEISSSEDTLGHILIIRSPCGYLEKSQQLFSHMTFWLIILHSHIKFGNKMFCSSEDTILTNIH